MARWMYGAFSLVFFIIPAEFTPMWRRALDMSYTFSEKIPIWPGHRNYDLQTMKLRDLGDFVIQTDNLAMPTHSGTHLDAPVHFSEGAWAVDEIPHSKLQGRAVVVDVTDKTMQNRDYEILPEDVMRFEARFGRIPSGAIVFFRTGWSRYWNDTKEYLGTLEKDLTKTSHPGMNHETARFLVNQRDIIGVGLDTVSLDPGKKLDFLTHIVLHTKNKWGIENVANMDKLPPVGSYVYVMPLKLMGASGAPVSVIAFY